MITYQLYLNATVSLPICDQSDCAFFPSEVQLYYEGCSVGTMYSQQSDFLM